MYKLVRMLYGIPISTARRTHKETDMITFTATITDTNARRIVHALQRSTDSGAKALVAQLRAHLLAQGVKCSHCSSLFATELAYAGHLAQAHHYLTNVQAEARGIKPEDTAETTAWMAFHLV